MYVYVYVCVPCGRMRMLSPSPSPSLSGEQECAQQYVDIMCAQTYKQTDIMIHNTRAYIRIYIHGYIHTYVYTYMDIYYVHETGVCGAVRA
jgi:hypothetical protein